jgi:hypothetical protein
MAGKIPQGLNGNTVGVEDIRFPQSLASALKVAPVGEVFCQLGVSA